MNRHDRLDARIAADRNLDQVRVDVESVRVDVDHQWMGPLVLDHMDRGRKRHRRAHDRIALTDPQGRERDVHR